MKSIKSKAKNFWYNHKPLFGGILSVAVLLIWIAALVAILGKKKVPSYDEIVGNLDNSTIITTNGSISANGVFTLAFTDSTATGSPTLQSLTTMFGIENNNLSLNGSLTYDMSTVYSPSAGYSNSSYRYMVFSNCQSLNDYLANYLPETSGNLEIYYDFTNGDTYTVSDNQIVRESGESPVTVNQDPSEIVSALNFVKDTAGDKGVSVKAKGDNSYEVLMKFDFSGEFLRNLSSDVKFLLNTAGYNVDSIAEVLDTTEENYGLRIPVEVRAVFSLANEKYRLESVVLSVGASANKNVPYSDIKQAYALTDAENFSADLNVSADLSISAVFGYDSAVVNLPK